MITNERRQVERVTLDRDRDLTLIAAVEGMPISASVIDISRKGLRVELRSRRADAPRTGAEVTDAFLGPPDSNGYRLTALTIAEVMGDPDADERVWLRLTTDDAATRAALWHVMERISQGAELFPGEVVLRAPENPPKVPARGQYTEAARLERLAWIRRESRAPMEALEDTRLSAERLSGNLEAMIGAIEVPVGLAGPLLIRGRNARGMFYAPLATTEGALVASATRGATAITRAGGVTVRALKQQMMRVPLFVLTNLEGTFLFARWVRDHVEELRAEIRKVSRHAELISVEPIVIGRMVHVHFMYETGDAAGQNMTTACTWHACQWMMRETQHFEGVEFENFIIEANISSDKKVTYRSFIQGRGVRVVAECMIPGDILKQTLKVTPEQLAQSNAAFVSGSIQAGMIGYNINIANIIAAMFVSTGQDIGCVHESAIGQLHLQSTGDAIYASMVLPSLIIGTVGGGTHLPGQHALLEMMGCAGVGKVGRLAEIIAGFCLALDLSTLSAIASGEFATAHERMGRNRPVKFLTAEDLSPRFFEPGFREKLGDPALTIQSVETVKAQLGSSIITELTARKVHKLVGLFPMTVRHSRGATDVIVKVKPLDEEVVLMIASMASMCGPKVAASYKRFRHRTGFVGGHTREIEIYRQQDPRFTAHVPGVYGTLRDDAREAYVVTLERLHDMAIIDSADDISRWTPKHVDAALTGLGALHAVWLGREDELARQPWLGPVQTSAGMVEMAELWEALAVHAAEEFPELVSPAQLAMRRRLIGTLGDWHPQLETLPRTLTHNDFNPRNVALRREGLRLCAYDWELATLGVPQHDLAELLCFVLPPDVAAAAVDAHLETHRRALEAASGRTLPAAEWREGYRLSLRDLAVNRFALYLMAHTFRHYGFMERTVATLHRLLAIEGVE